MKYNSSYFIGLLTFVLFTNILFNTFFISIFLAGVVFAIFRLCLKYEYYYILSFSVFTFLVIENTHNFTFLSLSFISLFLYMLIIPRIKHLFSSNIFAQIVYMFLFYISIFFYYIYTHSFNTDLYSIFISNFIIDSILAGVLL